MKKLFLYLLLVQLLVSCGIESRISKADKQFNSGEYALASRSYKNIYSKIPFKNKTLKASIAFKEGECYRKLNITRAEQSYKKAVRYNEADSLLFLRYAQVLLKNGKYGLADQNFDKYLEFDSISPEVRFQRYFISKIDSARNEPTGYNVSKLKYLISRRSSTFSPGIAPNDPNLLFFTSSRKLMKDGKIKISTITDLPNDQMYSVKKNNKGEWEKIEVLGPEINLPEYDTGTPCFSPDGKTLYFSAANQDFKSNGGVGIYYTNRTGGEWTESKKISFFKDTAILVAHPAIAPDGQTIVFVADAPHGKGGKDLWTGKLEGAECTFIKNMGPEINSAEDELFPAFKADGTLYFSSNGLPGFGGLDLFKAEMRKDSTWKVSNMGVPMNSSADDFGISFEGTENKGYFSSNRGEIKGYDAIFSFEKPELEVLVAGVVTDDKGTPLSDATIRLVSNSGMNIRMLTKKDGSYKIKIDKDIECVMLGAARGYLNKSDQFHTQGVKENKKIQVNFQLPAIYRPVQLNNLFFEFGKWNLTKNSEAGLQDLISMLKDNPGIVIEISAHTDYVGSDQLNMELSEKRARSVVDYLISSGIASAMVKSVGYGETIPKKVDENMHQKYSFLELGRSLTENYITSLAPEQQEIANQINRRTEFRVVKVSY